MAKGRILLVNACINRGESRTLRLARRVVSGYPDHDVEALVREDGVPEKIYVSGGITNSDRWLQMLSDIFRKEILILCMRLHV